MRAVGRASDRGEPRSSGRTLLVRATSVLFGAKLSESEAGGEAGAFVPGTGFEPVFLASETSVLPLDDPGVSTGGARARRTSPVAADGSREPLAAVGPEGLEPSPPRLRVECAYPIALRTRDLRAGATCVDAQVLRGTRGGRTLIPRVKSPVLGRLS